MDLNVLTKVISGCALWLSSTYIIIQFNITSYFSTTASHCCNVWEECNIDKSASELSCVQNEHVLFFCFGLYLSTNANYVHSVEEEIIEEGKAVVLCWLAVSCMLVSTRLTPVGSSSFFSVQVTLVCMVPSFCVQLNVHKNPSQTCPHHCTCFSSCCILASVQFTNDHTLI